VPATRQVKSRPETLARRRDILDAAVEIFGTRGFGKGSLQEIADRVDMTHAGVLHHFGSKDQLLLEVLLHRDDSDVAALAGRRPPDGPALFEHLVRTAMRNAERPGIVQAFVVLSSESVTENNPGRAYFEQRYGNLRAMLDAAFRVACAERGVEPRRVDDACAAILAVMDGLQVQWLLDPDRVDLARASAFAIEAIVRAVGVDITLTDD
jgi:AcrR family transcriptional regulator